MLHLAKHTHVLVRKFDSAMVECDCFALVYKEEYD